MKGAFSLSAAVIVAVVTIAVIVVAAAAHAIALAVGRTENRTKAAAGFWFCRGREHIQREANVFKVSAGVTGNGGVGAGFGHASAQRIDYHIYGAEQFYDGEQTDGNIDCHRSPHGCIAIGQGDGIAFAMVVVVAGVTAAAWIAQVCLQGDCLAFCDSEGAAVGITAAVIQIGGSGDIGFCGAKQSYPQMITVSGRDAADETAVSPTEFQCIVEYIFQFQIPAAFLQGIWFFTKNLDTFQFQITDGYISGIAGRNNDVSFAEHVVAAVAIASGSAGGAQDIRGQAFLDAALIEDFLGDDACFSCAAAVIIAVVVTVAVSCGQVKFKSSHKTASLKLFVFFYIV